MIIKLAHISYIYAAWAILFWSATPAVAKLALIELDNYQLLLYTSIIWTISLFLVNILQGKYKLLTSYTLKDYIIMFGMGTLWVFLYYIFLYGSFNLAPAGQVNVVNYLRPAFIIIFSIPILKENYNYKTIIAICLSFLWALTAFSQGNLLLFSNQYALGYLLAFLWAISYAIFSVFGKKLQYDKFSSMLIYYISATLLIIPTSIFMSWFTVPISPTTIFAILILWWVMNSLAFVFWFKALNLWNTHKIANLVYITPFLAMIRTYYLNNEPFTLYSLLGLWLIISWILIQIWNKNT